MAKKQNISLEDLTGKMGMVLGPDGTYSKAKTVLQPREIEKAKTKQGRPELPPLNALNTQIVHREGDKVAVIGNMQIPTCKFIIPGVISGLNGSNGLMRKHWSNTKKEKGIYINYINEQKAIAFNGCVKIEYVGYKSHFMDWDNFCSSFKHIGDALVKCGIIKDDSPSIVKLFVPNQIKCKRIEQRVEIIITAI